MNAEVGDGRTEPCDALRRKNVARARIAATPRNDFEQARGGFDAARPATHAELDRARVVAADADAKRGSAVDRFCAQAHVGGKPLEMSAPPPSIATETLARESWRERRLRERAAQIGGERAGIEDFSGIEPGERIASEPERRPPPRCRARRSLLRIAAPTPRSVRAPECCRAR